MKKLKLNSLPTHGRKVGRKLVVTTFLYCISKIVLALWLVSLPGRILQHGPRNLRFLLKFIYQNILQTKKFLNLPKRLHLDETFDKQNRSQQILSNWRHDFSKLLEFKRKSLRCNTWRATQTSIKSGSWPFFFCAERWTRRIMNGKIVIRHKIRLAVSTFWPLGFHKKRLAKVTTEHTQSCV